MGCQASPLLLRPVARVLTLLFPAPTLPVAAHCARAQFLLLGQTCYALDAPTSSPSLLSLPKPPHTRTDLLHFQCHPVCLAHALSPSGMSSIIQARFKSTFFLILLYPTPLVSGLTTGPPIPEAAPGKERANRYCPAPPLPASPHLPSTLRHKQTQGSRRVSSGAIKLRKHQVTALSPIHSQVS